MGRPRSLVLSESRSETWAKDCLLFGSAEPDVWSLGQQPCNYSAEAAEVVSSVCNSA